MVTAGDVIRAIRRESEQTGQDITTGRTSPSREGVRSGGSSQPTQPQIEQPKPVEQPKIKEAPKIEESRIIPARPDFYREQIFREKIEAEKGKLIKEPIQEQPKETKKGVLERYVRDPIKKVFTQGEKTKQALEYVAADTGKESEREKEFKKELRKDIGSTMFYTGLTGLALLTPIPGDEALAAAGLTGKGVKIAIGAARWGKAGVTTSVGVKLVPIGTKKLSEISAPQEQREIIKDVEVFKQAMQKGWESESTAFEKKAWYKKYAQNLPFVPAFAGKPEEFKEGTREFYKARGLTGQELEAAVLATERQRKAGLAGEAFGVFGANVASEIIGRGFVSQAFKETSRISAKEAGSKLFSKAFWQIGKAGIIEGAASEIATQEGRYKDTDITSIGIASGLGFLSAGTIGGIIASTKLARPGVSKAVEYVAYITDPFEKPGDITAEALIKGFRLPVATPVIIDTRAAKEIILGTSENISPEGEVPTPIDVPDIFPKKTILQQPSFTPTQTPTQEQPIPKPKEIIDIGEIKGEIIDITADIKEISEPKKFAKGKVSIPTQTQVSIPTQTQVSIPITPKVPVAVPITVPVDIPVNVPVDIPVNVPVDIPAQIPTDIPVNVPVPTNVPVGIPVNLPTPVSRMLIPPPVPLAFPAFGGGAGFGKYRGSKFINELAVGRKLLGDLNMPKGFDLSIFQPPKPSKKPSKKSSKAKKRKSKQSKKQQFDPLAFIFG